MSVQDVTGSRNVVNVAQLVGTVKKKEYFSQFRNTIAGMLEQVEASTKSQPDVAAPLRTLPRVKDIRELLLKRGQLPGKAANEFSENQARLIRHIKTSSLPRWGGPKHP